MSKLELDTEKQNLTATINELKTLLSSDENIRKQVATELVAVGKAFAAPRKTVILATS